MAGRQGKRMAEKVKRGRRPRNVDDGFVIAEEPKPDLNPSQYQYMTVMLPNDADINRFGADGWELVSVIPSTLDMAVFYFRKRP
jgi:hypothetical protein